MRRQSGPRAIVRLWHLWGAPFCRGVAALTCLVIVAVAVLSPLCADAEPAANSPRERGLALLRADPDAKGLREAQDLLNRACNAKDLRGCAWLGTLYRDGVGVGFDLKQAVALFRRSCLGKEQLGCALWGDAMARGLAGRADAKRGNTLMKKACDAGQPRGCALLGQSYLKARGVPFDQSLAVHLFRKSCKNNDMRGCGLQGVYENFIRHRSGDTYWLVKSRLQPCVAMLSQSCDRGDPRACRSLGWLFEDEKTIRHRLRAYSLYRRACRTGELTGCYQAVMAHCDTRRGPFQFTTDHSVEIGRLSAACRAGRAPACRFLARILRQKRCVKVDIDRSRRLMKRACAKGHGLSCYDHAEEIWEDKAVRDPDTTAKYFKSACDHGYGLGCAKLAKMLSEGRYMAKNLKKALKLQKRACRLGDFSSCSLVNR